VATEVLKQVELGFSKIFFSKFSNNKKFENLLPQKLSAIGYAHISV